MELLWGFLQVAAMLAAVLALAYLLLNKGLGKMLLKNQGSQELLLRERLYLEPKKSLYLVEVRGREFVLASGEGTLSIVCELSKVD
ncbi:MAG: flagellar biosynthetic protein FliO [Myxococcaceae bacterium]|nr:flagellar biosynthetic protein FliO [Myxococcaceae bacterium]MBH2005930.1 flagellar biosynthetic protein FliO [Myxococcaceae bacterium]